MAGPILVDISNLAYRCHYASMKRVKNRETGETEYIHLSHNGKVTSAIFGVLQSLAMVNTKYPGRECLCVFDSFSERRKQEIASAEEKNVIDSDYEYKGGRDKKSENYLLIRQQIDELREILQKTAYQVVYSIGFEADDLIGAYTVKYDDCVIMSSDKDFLQLLGSNTTLFDAMKKKEMREEYVLAQFGLSPEQLIDVGALEGDKSDNIPGVSGVGPKTAIKLIKAYGSVENMLQELEASISPSKMDLKLIEAANQIALWKSLKRITTEAPIPAIDPPRSDREFITHYFEEVVGANSLLDKVGLFCNDR